MKTVRENIKRLRKIRKLTQEELGNMLGKRKGSVSKIECNKLPLTDDDMVQIASIFNISPKDLFEDEIAPNKINSSKNAVQENQSKLIRLLNSIQKDLQEFFINSSL